MLPTVRTRARRAKRPKRKGYHRPSSSTTRTVSLNTNKLNLTMKIYFTASTHHYFYRSTLLTTSFDQGGHDILFTPKCESFSVYRASSSRWNAVPKFSSIYSFLPRLVAGWAERGHPALRPPRLEEPALAACYTVVYYVFLTFSRFTICLIICFVNRMLGPLGAIG